MKKQKITQLAALAFSITSSQLHAAWTATVMDTWPDAVVPYELDESIQAQPLVLERFYMALEEFESKTVIRFVERTAQNAEQYPNYKSIHYNPNAPYSSAGAIGMVEGESLVQLGTSTNGGIATDGSNWGLSVVIHELGHVLGLIHENSRADIWDAYSIDWDLVTKDNCVFPNRTATAQTVFLTDYDYYSVMNGYAPACGTNHLGGPSRDYATQNNVEVPMRDVVHQLSPWDVLGINTLYAAAVIEQGQALSVDVVLDEWDGGYCAHLNIVNSSGAAIEGWGAEIDLGDSEPYYNWSAYFEQNGSRINASNLSWNGALAPQASTEFGFCANGDFPEQTVKAVVQEEQALIQSSALSVSIATEIWEGGYCAYLDLANTSSSVIHGWEVTLDIGFAQMYESWSARFAQEASTLLVSEGFLAAQESVQLGYCANGDLPNDGIQVISVTADAP